MSREGREARTLEPECALFIDFLQGKIDELKKIEMTRARVL